MVELAHKCSHLHSSIVVNDLLEERLFPTSLDANTLQLYSVAGLNPSRMYCPASVKMAVRALTSSTWDTHVTVKLLTKLGGGG